MCESLTTLPAPAAMPYRLHPTRLVSPLAAALFSLPLYAADLGGLNNDYTPPPVPVKPKPTVVEKIVEKPIKDPAAEKRAQAAEAERKRLEVESKKKDAEIARLEAALAEARNKPPKERPVPVPVAPPPSAPVAVPAPPPQAAAPVPATDPAAACWKAGGWQAGCGFAAFAGGPVFRVVGGDLSFTMGSKKGSDSMAFDDEYPPHRVSFDRRFALAETEVTVAQYLACVQDGACKEPSWRESGSQYHYQTGSNDFYTSRNAHLPDSPITGASWNDAKTYVAWLSRKTGQTYTLPTEAQWEYAARGGQSTRWYFGDAESLLKDHAWYDANSGGKLHPVGSTRLNTHPWGLKDMAGNAWEWVEDCWHGSYNSAPSNGDKAWKSANGGECGQRVVRGGSWYNDARDTRAAYRVRVTTVVRDLNVSFRPSRMLP